MENYVFPFAKELESVNTTSSSRNIFNFSFIDTFAGIGGIRIGFEDWGGRCVFSCEYDEFSQKTYHAFFGEKPDYAQHFETKRQGDITLIKDVSLIPDHDILTGGFPCQPFSIAGVSKKTSLGRKHGFDDPTQGTLFFNIKEIISKKQPKAFLLENVKGLVSHDKGKTFEIIKRTIRSLGYDLSYRVINAIEWVPQNRERIYIVGFRKNLNINLDNFDLRLRELKGNRLYNLQDILLKKVNSKYTVGEKTWNTLKRHKERHILKGQGFGYGLIKPPFKDKNTRTLSARYYKDGAEILIDQGGQKRPRRLTPLECLRLMGFPSKYEKFFGNENQPVSDTQAYKQLGNSVAVPVVRSIAKLILDQLFKKQ